MLIGKAANLNESQIQELAKLQRGVAAIYQNEWIEPVLCHIEPHERGLEYSPTQSKNSAKDKASSEELAISTLVCLIRSSSMSQGNTTSATVCTRWTYLTP